MTEMTKLADEGRKTEIVSMFHLLENVEGNIQMMRRDMKDIKKDSNLTSRDEDDSI